MILHYNSITNTCKNNITLAGLYVLTYNCTSSDKSS